MKKYMEAGVREYWIVDLKRKKVVCYAFEGEDAPDIAMYTFNDRVPVRIWEGRLEVDFGAISERLWTEPRKNDAEGRPEGGRACIHFRYNGTYGRSIRSFAVRGV